MIKFSKRNEQHVKDRINAIFSLVGTFLFCLSKIFNTDEDPSYLIFKLIFLILFFWAVVGRIFANLLYALLKEIVEDQTEIEEDLVRKEELREISDIEKRKVKENIQKVKF